MAADRQYNTVAETITTQPGYVPNVSSVAYQTAGIAFLLAMGAGAMLAGLAYLGMIQRPVGLVFVAGVAAAFLPALVWRILEVDKSLAIKKVETQYGVDLDGDKKIGDTPIDDSHMLLVNPEQARADAVKDMRNQAKGIKRDELLEFIDTCFLKGTSEKAHGVTQSTRDRKYVPMRDKLMQLGQASWKNDENTQLGWVLLFGRPHVKQVVREHVRDL